MKRNIIINFMVIILLTLALAMIGFTVGTTKYYYDSIANTLENYAQGVVPVWGNDFDFSNEKLSEISDKIVKAYHYKDASLELLSRSGALIQSSDGFYNQKNYAVEENVRNGENSYRIRTDEETYERVMMVDSPLIYEGQVVGVLQYTTSLSKVNNMIRNQIGYGLFLCGLVAIIVFTVSLKLGNSIVKPLRDIIAFTHKMAKGQYKERIQKQYNYELGELSFMLNEMGDEILKADRLKNDFISSVSHELRTPLTGIKGWTEIMKNPDELTKEELETGLSIIHSETERLSHLVENLLDFSRYQSERMELIKEPTEVDCLVSDAVFQLRKKAEAKDVIFKVKMEEIVLEADSNKLKQVLLNVIDNAIKFSNDGQVIEIIQTLSEDYIEIKVIDHGIGIPTEQLNHITDSFYKIDSKSSGAGLGLAISRNIIELHGGTLHIESENCNGTIVTIRLPVTAI
jgi:signal transduction histidine kinase